MTREEIWAVIEETGIVPAVRVHSREDALFAVGAVFRGGIRIVELTLTVPNALEIISEVTQAHPDCVVGAGTVLDPGSAQACLDAGANFLTSPGLDPDVLNFAVERKAVVIPGALTPSEIMMARKAQVRFVKIFPCGPVGGPRYIHSLKGPFPDVPLIASGGVNQQNAADFIRSGAVALGIGEELIPAEAIERRDQDWIGELTHRFLGIVKQARRSKH